MIMSAVSSSIPSVGDSSKSTSDPNQATSGRIQIRPYRDSDSEQLRELFTVAIGSGKGSILHSAMKGQLADRISMGLYIVGSLSLCFQASQILTGHSPFIPGRYNASVYIVQAILLATLATFLNRAYGLYLAVQKFISLAMNGDMLDMGEQYGGRSLSSDSTDERKKNAYWVAELQREDGSSLIVGGTGIDVTTCTEPSSAELRRMVVSPICRRRGVGAQLIRVALDHAKRHDISSVRLTTSFYQTSALSLYEKFGWVRQRDFWYLGSLYVTALKLDLTKH